MTVAVRGRSLVWLVAGAFLLAAIVGAVLQGLAVLAVVRPIEAGEARARAELLVASVAAAYAAVPAPPAGAELDTLLRRQRSQHSIRPAVLMVRWTDGTLVTSPPEFVNFAARMLADSLQGSEGRGRSEILARHGMVHGGRRLGEVLVVRRVPRGPEPETAPVALLLYFPIAALISGALGLLLVRLLARRLRALEDLADRVAAGDLSARVADPRGDEIGRVAAQLDRMTERLATARDELQSNEQQRRQLFADITHELATPLTSIRGAAETLLNPQVEMSQDERTRYLRGVLEESGRLDRLIRDLFELARLEAGATPLDPVRLDWAALCRNTIDRFSPRYAAAKLHLDWSEAPAEAWVEADGLRLEQVLDNLLVNALRYVPAGGRVTVGLQRVDGPPARWRMIVSDDGPGIPTDELPHVFERFYRGAMVRGPQAARDAGGSGLGLAIVREIMERHGGAVRARAATPRGLSIEVELPAAG